MLPRWRASQIDTLVDRVRGALGEARIAATVGSTPKAVIVRIAERGSAPRPSAFCAGLLRPCRCRRFTEAQRDLDVKVLPDGAIELRPTQAAMIARRKAAVDQSLEIVRRRIDEHGVAEPTIQRLGADRILVQLPGVQDPDRDAENPGEHGQAELSSGIDGWLVRRPACPPGYEMLPGEQRRGIAYPVERQPMLQGDRLADAAAGFDQRTGQPIVTFRFDSAGAKRFAEITRANVGEPFAIVLDGKVLSAPVIQEPITGGSGQISGSFTVAETASLAALLRAGALPVPLQRHRGANRRSRPRQRRHPHGRDHWRRRPGAGPRVHDACCMARWGLVANLALLDQCRADVRGAEPARRDADAAGHRRHRAGHRAGGRCQRADQRAHPRGDPQRQGRGGRARAGFKRAYATIVDSNVTALIATALLFWFGSGPVRGFAVTMALGIVISMFTAVSVVKPIMAIWLAWRRPKQFLIEPLSRCGCGAVARASGSCARASSASASRSCCRSRRSCCSSSRG